MVNEIEHPRAHYFSSQPTKFSPRMREFQKEIWMYNFPETREHVFYRWIANSIVSRNRLKNWGDEYEIGASCFREETTRIWRSETVRPYLHWLDGAVGREDIKKVWDVSAPGQVADVELIRPQSSFPSGCLLFVHTFGSFFSDILLGRSGSCVNFCDGMNPRPLPVPRPEDDTEERKRRGGDGNAAMSRRRWGSEESGAWRSQKAGLAGHGELGGCRKWGEARRRHGFHCQLVLLAPVVNDRRIREENDFSH